MRESVPRVSIGLPVYNGERFLRSALDSILAQTFTEFELLISDNASTDHTHDICLEYAKRDKRICYTRNPANIGAAANYNKLCMNSLGRYFRWAATDDLFAPTSLERCVAVLEADGDVVLCYPRTTFIDAEGKAIESYNDNLDLRSTDVCERFRGALETGRVNAIYGLMRSEVLKKTSLIGNYPRGDADLLVDLSLYGRFFEIPEALFFRRLHGGAYSSITSVASMQAFYDPQTCGRLHFNHCRRMYEHSGAIWRAPLAPITKLRLSLILARRAVTARKEFLKELLLGCREMTRGRWFAGQRTGTM